MRLKGVVFFILAGIFLFGFFSIAQDQQLIIKTYQLKSSEKEPQDARRDMISQAATLVTHEVLREVFSMNPEQYGLQRIDLLLVRNFSKYIPYLKTGSFKESSEGSELMIELRVSVQELRQLLKSSGLIQADKVGRSVISFVRVEDRVRDQSYQWWSSTKPHPLWKQVEQLEQVFESEFQKAGFFVYPTYSHPFQNLLDESYQRPRLDFSEVLSIGRLLKMAFVLDGHIYLMPSDNHNEYRIEIKMSFYDVNSGKVVADVNRKFGTERGDFSKVLDRKWLQVVGSTLQDLVLQVQSSLESGAVGFDELKLVIKGPWSVRDFEPLKTKLREQVTLLRSVREHLVSQQELVFDITSAHRAQSLGEKLTGLKFQGQSLGLERVTSDTIYLRRL